MRLFRFFAFVLISAYVPARAQIGFGPEIGGGMSSMKFTPPQDVIQYPYASVSTIASGRIGGLIDVPMNRHFYFQAGLSASRKGAVRHFSYYLSDSFNESVTQTLYINYLELPVNVIWKSGHQGRGRFMFGLGAIPAYVIGGRNKVEDHQVFRDTLTNTNDNLKVVAGKTVSGFDIGVNLTAGYELPTGLFFRAYYTTGAKDIGIGTEKDKNRVWGIAIGYLFGKGRNVNKDVGNLIDKTKE